MKLEFVGHIGYDKGNGQPCIQRKRPISWQLLCKNPIMPFFFGTEEVKCSEIEILLCI